VSDIFNLSLHDALPISVARSVAVYTKSYLEAVYDPLVVHFSCRYAWKCPNRRVLDFYNEHVSACHLDVGVGTGYFLEKCHFPSRSEEHTSELQSRGHLV